MFFFILNYNQNGDQYLTIINGSRGYTIKNELKERFPSRSSVFNGILFVRL